MMQVPDAILDAVADDSHKARWRKFLLESFVEMQSGLTWCPAPGAFASGEGCRYWSLLIGHCRRAKIPWAALGNGATTPSFWRAIILVDVGLITGGTSQQLPILFWNP